MKDLLASLFSSKKFLVMLAGIILAIASQLGLNIDPKLLDQILTMVSVYIVGQGIADHGKEAAKVAAAAPANDNAEAVKIAQAGSVRYAILAILCGIAALVLLLAR